MVDFCPTEVDEVSDTICPFDTNHITKSFDKFRKHIKTCKEQYNPKIAASFCPYSELHCFQNKLSRDYHVPRCRNHPNRAKGERYQECPEWGGHRVVVREGQLEANRASMKMHLKECPARKKSTKNALFFGLTAHSPVVQVSTAVQTVASVAASTQTGCQESSPVLHQEGDWLAKYVEMYNWLEAMKGNAQKKTEQASLSAQSALCSSYLRMLEDSKSHSAALIVENDSLRKDLDLRQSSAAPTEQQQSEYSQKVTQLALENDSLKARLDKLKCEHKSALEANIALRAALRVSTGGGSNRKMQSLFCEECGSNVKNTVFVPCGHMSSCNVCLENRGIEVGKGLKYMNSAEKVCGVCHGEIRKAVVAYYGS